MRKVKYVYKSFSEFKNGKVYDVLRHIPATTNSSVKIEVLNEQNIVKKYSMWNEAYGHDYFVDITKEYRNEVIDSILD